MDKVTWQSRPQPLPPLGILVSADQRDLMKKLLLDMSKERLANLRGSYSETEVIILGEESYLPWLPGAVYLGKEQFAPHLYIPTLLTASVPLDLLDKAMCQKFGNGQFVVNPWKKEVYNLSQALKISQSSLGQMS